MFTFEELLQGWRWRRERLLQLLLQGTGRDPWRLKMRVKILTYLISRYSSEPAQQPASGTPPSTVHPSRCAGSARQPGIPRRFLLRRTGRARRVKRREEIRALLDDIHCQVEAAQIGEGHGDVRY